MVPGVLLIMSINLALKKLSFEGTWAIWRSSFHTFLAKSARHKKHPSTLNTDCTAIFGSISIILFSLASNNYREKPQSIWASHWIIYWCYKRLNMCSDFFGTPGISFVSTISLRGRKEFPSWSGDWKFKVDGQHGWFSEINGFFKITATNSGGYYQIYHQRRLLIKWQWIWEHSHMDFRLV